MRHVFRQIEKLIDIGITQRGQRTFTFDLPRQCGASTYLIKKANQLAKNGDSVMLLVHNTAQVNQFKRPIHDIETGRHIVTLDQRVYVAKIGSPSIKGRSMNAILLDNFKLAGGRDKNAFRTEILPVLRSGKDGLLININTVEGDENLFE